MADSQNLTLLLFFFASYFLSECDASADFSSVIKPSEQISLVPSGGPGAHCLHMCQLDTFLLTGISRISFLNFSQQLREINSSHSAIQHSAYLQSDIHFCIQTSNLFDQQIRLWNLTSSYMSQEDIMQKTVPCSFFSLFFLTCH